MTVKYLSSTPVFDEADAEIEDGVYADHIPGPYTRESNRLVDDIFARLQLEESR